MSNTIFTDAGRALIASCLAEKKTLNVTELVFADVPNLDTDSPPNPAAGLRHRRLSTVRRRRQGC